MPHLLGAEALDIVVGSRPLFRGLTLGLDDGARVGVVGQNGAGKSTLLATLAGRRRPDGGRVTRTGGVRLEFVSQSDDLDPTATVRHAIHGDLADHEWASQAHIRDIHHGLVPDLDLEAPVGQLSGGQRRRVALAAALTSPFEVLVLDEPTNHLDVEAVAWLARHLNGRFAGGKGALVVVTHDRWFLDAVCTRMWEVVPGRRDDSTPGHVDTYEGGYAAWILARAERERLAAVTAQKRDNTLRKELAWLRRGAPARTTKPRFRLDAAAALIANEPPPRDEVSLTKLATARLGKDVIDVEGVSFAYDGAAPLFDDVTWRLAPGERVGIVGVNGAGKSTLLQLLAKRLAPTRGRVKHGKTVVVASLSQDTAELDTIADLRVVEAVAQVRERVTVGDKEMTASQLTERLGFSHDRAWTQVGELSGGERRRLQLMRILVGEPNVLLLDEPTNDLDTDTLANIEDLLDMWPGTLVVVSHDRYLLERVTDHQVALLGDGRIRSLPGGVEEYLALREASDDGARPAGGARTSGGPRPSGGSLPAGGSPGSGTASQASGSDAAQQRAARKEMQRLERQIEQLAKQIAAKEAELAVLAAGSADYARMAELGDEVSGLRAQHDDLETRWLELLEELD